MRVYKYLKKIILIFARDFKWEKFFNIFDFDESFRIVRGSPQETKTSVLLLGLEFWIEIIFSAYFNVLTILENVN